jgi:hypothetical protein
MAHRIFRDTHGGEWQVWAVIPTLSRREQGRRSAQVSASLPTELVQGWLAFLSESERRRIVPIPPAWETASDAELQALLERAEVVREARRLIE